MKLYPHDYTQLTPNEIEEWRSINASEAIGKINNPFVLARNFFDYPKAVRHFDSLFPNNYLDPADLRNTEEILRKVTLFNQVLDSPKVTERDILNFLVENQAYFIVASILKVYFHFGHHGAFLFPEFQLGNSYKVDYLLAGKSSEGWNFVFVELESPLGQITLHDGELGSVFRKGIEQIKDWDAWLESNYFSLKETFYKDMRKDQLLPDEFINFDKSRMNYVVIAGRREHFNKKTYRERRSLRKSSLLILHYDNLIDAAKNLVGEVTY